MATVGARTTMVFINSANRDSDSIGIGDFRVTFGNALLQGLPGESLSVEVTDLCINRSWYTVNASNGGFGVVSHNADGSSSIMTNTILPGYYTVASLRVALATLMIGWTIGYDTRTNTYSYTAPTSGFSYSLTFPGGVGPLLGFAATDSPTVMAGVTLRSYLPIRVNLESSVVLHCDFQKVRCASIDNLPVATSVTGISAFRESDVLISVGIDVAPFSNVIYTSSGTGIYEASLTAPSLNRVRFWVTDELNNPLALAYDYNMALKFTFTSRLENTVDGNVKQIANDLRLMILSDPKTYGEHVVAGGDDV